MADGGATLIGIVLAVALLPLGACDDPPAPRQERKLVVPKGESALDSLIRKAQQRSAAPPTSGRLEAKPGSVDFSAVTVGRSATRQVQIINTGEAPIRMLERRVAGQAAAFLLAGTCVVGQDIAGGRSCTIEVTYRPLRDGVADSELVIDHEGGGALFIGLAGEAKPSPEAPPSARPAAAEASLLYAGIRQGGGLAIEDGGGALPAGRPAMDVDYTQAGLPGIVSSFPVERSRVITADRYIPAVLENTVNSQLPGRAIAVVERNVYGADGRLVLIPAGSRVIGRYQSLAKFGEARLDVNWSRIIRPDGVNINIDTVAADVMGRAGLPGDLDTRFFEKYGSSLLTSVIAAAGDWVLNGASTAVTSPLGGTTQVLNGRAAAANRLGNDLDLLGQRMVEENVDMRPVLTVPQGTRLNIIPAEDIWLRDPNRIQAATPPRARAAIARAGADNAMQLVPGLVDLIAQNPTVGKFAPQTAQQVMQSNLLQQLRSGNFSLPSSARSAQGGEASQAPVAQP